MTESEFNDWKASPSTKEVLHIIREKIVELQEQLGDTAGSDSRVDSIKVGAIQAFKDILEIKYEETH